MPAPSPDGESATLARFVETQLDAIRACLLGLTEEQARATPTASSLSPAGIVKHIVHAMRGWVDVLTSDPRTPATYDDDAFAEYAASFALTADQTAVGTLADFDAARGALRDAITQTDPDTDTLEPAAPWDGVFDERPGKRRTLLVHMIEELARHAGHADIIREQLDGQLVPSLVLTERGVPANDFFAPYVPAPDTIGA